MTPTHRATTEPTVHVVLGTLLATVAATRSPCGRDGARRTSLEPLCAWSGLAENCGSDAARNYGGTGA